MKEKIVSKTKKRTKREWQAEWKRARTCKVCSKCGKRKKMAAFQVDSAVFDGRRADCAECNNSGHKIRRLHKLDQYRAASREWAKHNSDRVKAYMASYRKTNKKALDKRIGEWRERHPGCERKWMLKKLYGLSVEDYDRLLAYQKGGCAICGMTKEENGRSLAVDHQHGGDGLVNGLLCVKCNRGVGVFKDSEQLLLKAMLYVQNPPARKVLNNGQPRPPSPS